MKVVAEYTDTFGGQANYCWVRRTEFDYGENMSDLSVVRRVKKDLGLTGVKCRRETWGEDIVLWPIGEASVVLIGFSY